MTEEYRHLECISRDLKVLWDSLKSVFSVFGGNRCWVPLECQHFR